jgi:hypothetical protein
MTQDSYELTDEIELIQSFPLTYAREVTSLLRRLRFLKMQKSEAPDYDKSLLNDVDDLRKFIDALLYAHELDLESFIEINYPNVRLVSNTSGDQE